MQWNHFLRKSVNFVTPVIFVQSLFFKLTSAPESVYIFTRVGMEPWGRYITASFELLASILFFVPGLSWLGAFIAIMIMIGAIFSHLTLLGVVVADDSGLLFGMALTVFATSSYKLYEKRHEVPWIGNLLKETDDLAKSYDQNFKKTLGHRLPILIIISLAMICGAGIIQEILTINLTLADHIPTALEARVAQWSYFMTLIYVFVTFLVTLIVLRLFEHPLHELIMVCFEVARGNKNARSKLPVGSELGVLSASMNRMLSELQAQEKVLRDKTLDAQHLLRVVIHDIANPLTLISLASKSAKKNANASPAENEKYWDRVIRASEKINSLITATRNFEAVRSGGKALVLHPTSTIKCVNTVIESVEESARNKSIQFKVTNSTGLNDPRIFVDETLFVSSIIANLVTNAIKFSPIHSEIELKIFKAGENKTGISVIDLGSGMPQEVIQKTLKGEPVESRVGTAGERGTGFGLGIVSAMIKSMNGELKISSSSQGTEMTTVFETCPT